MLEFEICVTPGEKSWRKSYYILNHSSYDNLFLFLFGAYPVFLTDSI